MFAGEAPRELPEEVQQPEEESGPGAGADQAVRPADPGGEGTENTQICRFHLGDE